MKELFQDLFLILGKFSGGNSKIYRREHGKTWREVTQIAVPDLPTPTMLYENTLVPDDFASC